MRPGVVRDRYRVRPPREDAAAGAADPGEPRGRDIAVADAGEAAEDFVMAFNLGGIRLSPAAFQKLRKEISLEPISLQLPELWGSESFQLFRGLVTVDNDIFRKIVLRESRVAQVDPRNFRLQKWTDKSYYEVCSDPAIYEQLETEKAVAAARS